MIQSLMDQVLQAPPWVVYLTVGAVVLLEDALFVGFVIPGETVAILGGVSANLGHTSLSAILAVVVVAAVVGDSVGYEIGRVVGPRIIEHRVLAKRRVGIGRAQGLVARKGGLAVFLARWTAFLRAVTPALSGMAGMPYRTFLPWNALGGIAWGATVVAIGYLAGASYQHLQRWLGSGALVVVGGVALVAVGAHLVRRRRGPAARLDGLQ